VVSGSVWVWRDYHLPPAPEEGEKLRTTSERDATTRLEELIARYDVVQYHGFGQFTDFVFAGLPALSPPQASTPKRAMSNPLSTPGNRRWTSRTYLESRCDVCGELLTVCRFIGKTGGEIFHEMMLRQGVKHICTFPYMIAISSCTNAMLTLYV
jgi:hypothetical protein